MPSVSWIEHKGKPILLIDYHGCNSEREMLEVLKNAQQAIIEHNAPYLQLTDISSVFVTPRYMREAKRVASETPKLATKRAIVGITNQARRILLQTYNMILGTNTMKPFDTLEEAKDWLVS